MRFTCKCVRCGKEFNNYRVAMYCSPVCRFRTPMERFLAKITRVENGCWNWTAKLNEDGYGEMRLFGPMVKAHRVSWILHRGEIPDGQQVLHLCIGNRACVNPEHLYLGDNAKNVADRVRQGRDPDRRGEKHPQSIFTDNDALQIKALKGFVPIEELMKRYNASRGAIGGIWYNLTYKHLFLSPLRLG